MAGGDHIADTGAKATTLSSSEFQIDRLRPGLVLEAHTAPVQRQNTDHQPAGRAEGMLGASALPVARLADVLMRTLTGTATVVDIQAGLSLRSNILCLSSDRASANPGDRLRGCVGYCCGRRRQQIEIDAPGMHHSAISNLGPHVRLTRTSRLGHGAGIGQFQLASIEGQQVLRLGVGQLDSIQLNHIAELRNRLSKRKPGELAQRPARRARRRTQGPCRLLASREIEVPQCNGAKRLSPWFAGTALSNHPEVETGYCRLASDCSNNCSLDPLPPKYKRKPLPVSTAVIPKRNAE
jgi:hypothetical protein